MGKVVEEIVSDLTPFDVNDESVTAFEDRIERLEKVSISLQIKVYRLKNEVKAKIYQKIKSYFRILSSPAANLVSCNPKTLRICVTHSPSSL